MLTRKPLTITVMATHQRWDGLAGSRNPPMRDPDCGRAVASGRAMVTIYLWGNPQISAVSCAALLEAVHHPTKAPAVEIDVLIHAIAVERLLLHKRPRCIHIRHVEEEYAAYGLLAVVDRKSTRLNSSHLVISYAVFCLKKKKIT